MNRRIRSRGNRPRARGSRIARVGRREPTRSLPRCGGRDGLGFRHTNGATGHFYMPEIMGSGVALFDYDNDGDLDVYLVQGRPLDGAASATSGNRLFRNDLIGPGSRGELHFTDVTDRAKVGLSAVGMGVAVGDIDNDGWRDLYVTNFGSNVLYRNNGDGTFSDVHGRGRRRRSALEHERGVSRLRPRRRSRPWSSSTTWRSPSPATRSARDHAGARDYCPPGAYAPVPSRLFRNDGGGRFTDVTRRIGLSRAYGAGLGVAVGDFDTTAGPTSTSPTMRWPTSSGSISETARSRIAGSCQGRR